MDCLNPRLPQFLRLGLKHAAPAESSQPYYSVCVITIIRGDAATLTTCESKSSEFTFLNLRYIFVYTVSFHLGCEVKQKNELCHCCKNTTIARWHTVQLSLMVNVSSFAVQNLVIVLDL